MTRKQVYIEKRQDRALKARAKKLGITEAEVIRRALDQQEANEPDDDAARSAAWASFLAFARERGKMKVPQGKREWTRDDLYEERFERYSR